MHVFSRRMVTKNVWIPEFLVRICCFASSITSTYVKNLQFRTYKKSFQTYNGTSVTITSNSLLTEPLWSGHSSDHVRVSSFMAAYKREIADKRFDGRAAALCLLMYESQNSHMPYSLQAASLMNIRGLPPPVAVRDYIGRGCSAVT